MVSPETITKEALVSYFGGGTSLTETRSHGHGVTTVGGFPMEGATYRAALADYSETCASVNEEAPSNVPTGL